MARLFSKIVLLILCFSSFPVVAQTMAVASFKLDEADQTANMQPTMKFDRNGEKCALIKINTTQRNFNFDVGILGVESIEWQNTMHPGEIWVYVPSGALKMTIQHPQLGIIKDFDFGTRLKKGKTYYLDLTTDQVNTMVIGDLNNLKKIKIHVNPSNAQVFINGLVQKYINSAGQLDVELPVGIHNYSVIASNYYPEESSFSVDETNDMQNLYINLKPAFGLLSIDNNADNNGSEVWIDNKKVGKIPLNEYQLSSGKHQVKILQKYYLPFIQEIIIKDNEKVHINPKLSPNFSNIEIMVPNDGNAEIYANGQFLANGQWAGKIEAGPNLIEVKKNYHSTISKLVNIENNKPEFIMMEAPLPLKGNVKFEIIPNNSTIRLDGKKIDSNFVEISAGPHRVKLDHEGYISREFDIIVSAEDITVVKESLSNIYELLITSNSNYATVYIDNKKEGVTPLKIYKPTGKYKLEISNGYDKKILDIKFPPRHSSLNVKLKKYKPKLPYINKGGEFYIEAGFNQTKTSNLDLGIGFFINHFNCEWEITVPFSYSMKLGYGINLAHKLRLTPQTGFDLRLGKDDAGAYEPYFAIPIKLRLNYAFSKWIGIYIAPGYNIPIAPENKGINISAGLYFSIS